MTATVPTIVAIGGADFGPAGTEAIDRYIIEQARVDHPRVLFIPTASRDSQEYIDHFTTAYESLGCTVDSLCLTRRDFGHDDIQTQIAMADIVYVGGGNTLFLLNYWQANGVDRMLHAAWQRGTVMAGLSAGCIVWHERGLTDSVAGEWQMIYALGWVPGFVSPHFDSEPARQPALADFVQRRGTTALALEDRTAVVYSATGIREFIASSAQARVWEVEADITGRFQVPAHHQVQVRVL